MRRLLVMPVMLAMTVGLFAGGADEDMMTLTVLKTGDDKYDVLGIPQHTRWGTVQFEAYKMGVNLIIREIGAVDAGNFDMDLLIAGGDVPDIYQHGSAADVSKYAQPGFAIDLSKHLDLSVFPETVLDRHRVDGGIYGLAEPLATLALSINTDMADEAGWTYPGPDWSLDDLRDLCKAIKSEGNGYCWGLFASRGGDWRQLLLQTTLGMEYYLDGDHTRTNIGVEFFNLLQEFMDNGWAPPNGEALIDDSIIARHSTVGHPEAVAVFPTFPGHNKSFMLAGWAVGDDHVDDLWSNQMFVPWPQTQGPNQIRPTIVTSGSLMGVASGDPEKDAMIAKIIMLSNSCTYSKSQQIIDGKARIRSDCPDATVDDIPLSMQSAWTVTEKANWAQRFRWAAEVADIAATHGSYDYGVGQTTSGALRDLFPIFQRFFSGELNASQMHAEYVRQADAILAANK